MNPTIYTKPDCPACDATKKYFSKYGVEYVSVDITENDEALNLIKSLGYNYTPVVVVNESNHWQGFRPDKIASLKIIKHAI